MTTFVLTFLLDREVDKLNRVIDKKIAQGKTYKREAEIHKELLQRITKIRRQGNVMAMF